MSALGEDERRELSRRVAEARGTVDAFEPARTCVNGCRNRERGRGFLRGVGELCAWCVAALIPRGEPKPYASRPDLILPVLRDLCREQDVTVTIVLARDGATGVLWQGGPTSIGFQRGEVAEAACEAYLALRGAR